MDSCESLVRSAHSDIPACHFCSPSPPGGIAQECDRRCCLQVLWGYRTFNPQDYWGYFSDTGVTDVVRLNNKVDPLFAFLSPVPKLACTSCLTFATSENVSVITSSIVEA